MSKRIQHNGQTMNRPDSRTELDPADYEAEEDGGLSVAAYEDTTLDCGLIEVARFRRNSGGSAFGLPMLRNQPTVIFTHPLVWLACSSLVFLAAWLFPPDLYRRLFGNETFVFLDELTFLFNGSCILLLVAGLVVGKGLMGHASGGGMIAKSPLHGAPWTSHILMLGMIAMNAAAIGFYIYVGGLGVLMSAFKGDVRLGYELTQAAERMGTGKLWLSLLSVPSVFVPLGWQMSRTASRGSWIRLLFVIFMVTFFLAACAGGKRNYVARPVFGCLLLYLVWPGTRAISRVRAGSIIGAAVVLMLLIFVVLGQFRNAGDARDEGIGESLRYLICPFNTEAMIVNREMQVPGSGKGYFWTLWIWEFPVVSQVFHLPEQREKWFGTAPPYGALDRSEVLHDHGLSAGTNITAYGESFVDMGWFGAFPFFFLGILGGAFWQLFLSGRLAGLLFYPLVAYAFLELRGNIQFPSQRTAMAILVFLSVAIALMIEKRGARPTAGDYSRRSTAVRLAAGAE